MRGLANGVHSVVSAGIVLAVAALSVFCLWALDRGLDLTDEAYYVAASIHPESVAVWATAMHWLTAGLWKITGSLVSFRALGLAILAASSVILAAGADRGMRGAGVGGFSRDWRGSTPLVVACSLVGALLYHSFMPFTPSYNLLAAAGAYAGLGLVLLASDSRRDSSNIGLALLAGVALGITFLQSFPAGVSVWIVVLCIAWVFGGAWPKRLWRVAMITFGMAGTVGLAVVMHGTPEEVLAQFRRGAVVYMLGANETLEGRLSRYSTEMFEYLRSVIAYFGVPLLLLGIHAVRPHRVLALAGFVTLGGALFVGDFLAGGMGHYERQTEPLLTLLVAALMLARPVWLRCARTTGLTLVLAGLPFCVAVGTYNALAAQILFSLAPWGALVGLLAFDTAGPVESRPLIQLIGGLFVAVVVAQVLSSGLHAPYRLHPPLQEQSDAITVAGLGRIRVDPESRASYDRMNELAKTCGIEPGSPFLGLYNLPGVALWLQLLPIGFPILQDRPSTEAILEILPPEEVKTAVVGINRDSGSYDPGIPRQLQTFPAQYRLCGTAVLPYHDQRLELWINR